MTTHQTRPWDGGAAATQLGSPAPTASAEVVAPGSDTGAPVTGPSTVHPHAAGNPSPAGVRRADARTDPGAHLRHRPVPRAWGWAVAGGGPPPARAGGPGVPRPTPPRCGV